jgi:predicted MFS family arabinose efflux permease
MMGLGPVMAEYFAYRWGFKVIFASIPVLSVLIAWVLTRLHQPLAPHGVRPQPYFEAMRASLPGLRAILILSVFFGLCFAAWNSFIAPAVKGVGPGAVSSFGLGYALGAVVTRLGLSTRLDAGSRRLWAILSLVAYAIALGLIPHAGTRWEFMILGLICGMVHGIYYPCLSSIAAERFHPLHTAQAMSLYVSASSLGMFIGPPLWGAVADSTGYPWMFRAAAALLGTSAVLFVVFHRRSSLVRQQTVSSRRQAASEPGI